MVPEVEIPPDILRFIEENIDDVPQLETLLMMSQATDRSWLVTEIAARIYIAEQRAEEILSVLGRRGLVSSAESPPRFRFDPATPEMRALVAAVAAIYQTNLSRIATIVHSKPSASQPVVNILGTLVAALCAILLLRAYRSVRKRLLLWAGLCFAGLSASNALVIADLFAAPEIDLYRWRLAVAAVAMMLLVYGLIFESDQP
jgi:hypothetical protein